MKVYCETIRILPDKQMANRLQRSLEIFREAYPRMVKKLCIRLRYYKKYDNLPVGFRRDLRSISEHAMLEAMLDNPSSVKPWKKCVRRNLYLQALYLVELFRRGNKEKYIRDFIMPERFNHSLSISPVDMVVNDDMVTAEIPMMGTITFKDPALIPDYRLIKGMWIGNNFDKTLFGKYWYLYYEQTDIEEESDKETEEVDDDGSI